MPMLGETFDLVNPASIVLYVNFEGKEGLSMPLSFAALQIYDQYLTTYRNSKHSSRYDIHDKNELRHIYNSIQLKNRFSPLYLTAPTKDDITYAVRLKENALQLRNTISSLSGDDEQTLFSQKAAYSSNPDLAEVEYYYDTNATKLNVPESFHLKIKSFATSQINQGSFLPADQPVILQEGNYSFDIVTNKLHYELQFRIHEEDTHKDIQEKLARLINNSDIGIVAEVITDQMERSSLQLTSQAKGLPVQKTEHFFITDEHATHTSGVVRYFGLNKSIHDATNAVYELDGQEHTSYSNSFTAYQVFRITLHPEYPLPSEEEELPLVTIGLYPDTESLSHNMHCFVTNFNQFISSFDKRLQSDIKKMLADQRHDIEKYGIHINEDATLSFQPSENNKEWSDTSALQSFGEKILDKLEQISLDPMSYVTRSICAYSNPATPFVNPYATSIYSGMLCSFYC